ncbi:MAG: tryptophan 7-halogenase, partial [Pirellulales bacterium]
MTEPVRKIIVLGGGSAGFIAAINVKAKNPDIEIVVVRSADIGIIRVGESTIHTVPKYLHHYLGIDPGEFFREVDPTWKLGIRFLWGPRERFHYTFRVQVALHYEYLPN